MSSFLPAVGLMVGLTASALAVTPVPAGTLIQYPANPFDLEGKTLRFRPSGGQDLVEVGELTKLHERGALLGAPDRTAAYTASWRVGLPFSFPYAGTSWRELFVNRTGSISFGRPETETYPERNTWPGGTMRRVAEQLQARGAGGTETMIAVLWALHSTERHVSQIYVNSSPADLVVTWDVQRRHHPNEGYQPLGKNIYQVRLTPDGRIEMSYEKVAERDGIVGLFNGQTVDGERVEFVVDPEDAPDLAVEMLSAELRDAGSMVRFTIRAMDDVPEQVASGQLFYRVFLEADGIVCELGLRVDNRRTSYSGCPSGAWAAASGSRVDILVSKLGLRRQVRWNADITWFNSPRGFLTDRMARRNASLPQGSLYGTDLSGANGSMAGQIFEVFHCPFVSKDHDRTMSYIYSLQEPEDDLAVVFTDFRIDDLHNHGGSTGPVNVPIQGGGPSQTQPRSGTTFRSSRLQVACGPIFLGPRFNERTSTGQFTYHGYATAIGWVVHELVHRWGITLRYRNPNTADQTTLLSADRVHWNDFLHLPPLHPVNHLFSQQPYPEASPMGGRNYVENPDGTYRRTMHIMAPSGLSALDLYLMGMLPPEEVPETFLLTNPSQVGPDLFRGGRTPVRIEDIIAASGQRVPHASAAQKRFQLGVYLVHEDGRGPDPARMRQAEGIEAGLERYFATATGARLTVVPSPPTPTELPVVSIGGVTDAFNFQPGAAGSTWLAIFGRNLSTTTRTWDGAIQGDRLPESLDGVSVTLDGRAATIFFISPGQINILAPMNFNNGQPHAELVVRNAIGTSGPVGVRRTETLPAFYAPFSDGGRGYVTAVAVDGTLVGKPGVDPRVRRGARPNETLQVFGVGFGETNPARPSNQLFSGAPVLTARPVIRIGDRTVSLAGNGNLVAPGLYQFNITVPGDLESGDYPLVAETRDATSPSTVFLTVEK